MPEPARHVEPLREARTPRIVTDALARRLKAIDGQIAPTVLARDELIPVLGTFEHALGSPGLGRGSVIAVSSAGAPGATSIALALLAKATAAGLWCAVVGLPDLGLEAAAELGLSLDRLVLVPAPSASRAKVLATLLEGCDIVVAAGRGSLALAESRRLAAQARERRSVLLPLRRERGARPWPEPPDIELRVTASSPFGIDRGVGRLHSRLVDIEVTRRRMHPRTVNEAIWLPGRDGSVVRGDPGELAGIRSQRASSW